MRKFLFKVARSEVSGMFIGYAFENMASIMPLDRVEETHRTIVFRHPVPQREHHLLAVPKKSLRDFESIDFENASHIAHLHDLLKTIQTVASQIELNTFAVLMNGGEYQDVPQIHFHIISGKLALLIDGTSKDSTITHKQTLSYALCDGGGSNNARHYLFKADLQILADQIGREIRIAYDPPYTSKHNPIEHRLFPHITRACQGVLFKSVELVKHLMERSHTQQGLQVTVQIIDKIYQIGRKVTDEFKQNMPIQFDSHLPHWNYRAVPNGQVI
jgi:diadenosine tetraphosphate (Ap4A) HIT family hydrolase